MKNEFVIDKNERIFLDYETRSGNRYLITSDKNRSDYFLYKIENNKAIKTKKTADNPIKLERYIQKKEGR